MATTWTDTSGWRADFRQADEQFARQADRLRSLVGRRILETWTVVTAEDEWWESQPVVLHFDDGRRLEVCWMMSDELSITWNTIDVTDPPVLFDDVLLHWHRDHEPAARSVVGADVTSVEAVIRQEQVARRRPRSDHAVTSGLWLGTGTGGLQIFNAADTNGLSATVPTIRHHRSPRRS